MTAAQGGPAGPLYVDSSALAKLYLPELESDAVDGLLRGRTDLQVSELAITEVVSAACRRRREGILGPRDFDRLVQQILADADAGLYARLSLDTATHREAERLMASHEVVSLRALDALHLALAVRGESRTVVTYDLRLGQAAGILGVGSWPEKKQVASRPRRPRSGGESGRGKR